MAFAVAQPADSGGQTLEGHPLPRQLDPSSQAFIFGEFSKHGAVGGCDVCWIARQCHPAERAFAFAKERSDICGDESRVVEGTVVACKRGFGPQAVAVVEYFCTGVEKADHGLDVGGHGVSGAADELVGLIGAHLLDCFGG